MTRHTTFTCEEGEPFQKTLKMQAIPRYTQGMACNLEEETKKYLEERHMLQRNAAVLWRELDGEAVLLDPTAGCSYNLNQVGTFIWKLLDGEHTPEEIATAICEAYDEVVYEQALQDVGRIVEDLRDNTLLSESVSPSHV